MSKNESLIKETEWGSMEIGGPRHAFREELMFKAFQKRLRGGRVLDAGCGSGSMLLRLLKDGYEVAGVDMSERFVDMVRDKLRDSGYNGDIKKGSITDLPFPSDSFDGVIAGEVLEHVEDDAVAVKELWRILKRSGVCAVSVPANPGLWDESDDWAGHKRRYTKEALVHLFEGCGFSVEDVFFWGFPLVRLWNRFVFMGWLRGGKGAADSKIDPLIRHKTGFKAGLKGLLIKTISFTFRFDNLFNSLPYGTGLILVARK